jgi:transposase
MRIGARLARSGICPGDRRGGARQFEDDTGASARERIAGDRDRDRGSFSSGFARDRRGNVGDGVARREGSDMISVPAGIRILVATKPVDFRRGADSLAALVREQLQHDPFSGTLFIFRSKRADRLKILAWDGSGLMLVWKRLEQGAFRWPPISDGVMRLSASQLAALVDGLDWARLQARDVPRPQATS